MTQRRLRNPVENAKGLNVLQRQLRSTGPFPVGVILTALVIHNQSRLPLAVVLGKHVKNQALIRDTDFQKIRQASQLDRSGCNSSRKGLDGWRFQKVLTQNKPSSR